MEIFWYSFFGCFVAFLFCELLAVIYEFIKQKREDEEDKEEFLDLMAEFDEMGYTPTTFCSDPENVAKEYKKKLETLFYKTSKK